jgi:hypothetical protein
MKYDNVIVCHEGTGGKSRDLHEIAFASGSRVWDFNVWKHSIQSISEDESRSQRRRQAQTEEVTA